MENFIYISPNFPEISSSFVKSLALVGFRVLGIGDGLQSDFNDELNEYLSEYYFVKSLSNKNEVEKAISYFIDKYGPISYLESNNEYWLFNDSYMREKFNISTGIHFSDIDVLKYKSKMKSSFKQAGVKVSKYIITSTLENSIQFVKEVGYPVFVKPDSGVGAKNSYKINNFQELLTFHSQNYDEPFIMEQYIDGEIVSFDGICNWDSDVAICFSEHFPIPVSEVVLNNIDDYYYATTFMDPLFLDIGKRCVKAFNLKKRCFHIEFFKLNKDHPGLGKKGDYIGIEINARPPGGNTPTLLSLALNESFYDCFAQIMKDNKISLDLNKPQYIAISGCRRDEYNYLHTNKEILETFKNNNIIYGRYPKSISDDMGDEYYFARFRKMENVMLFQQYINAKKIIN